MSNVLLGGCIGDALGKAFESKPADNPLLLSWDQKSFLPSEYHGLKGNQFTDDGQMLCMVAESLIENNGFNPDNLAARYVDWIESGRARGYGRTTLLAIQALKSGKHWSESGVNGSYGNGTAMRSAPFGIYFRDNLDKLLQSVRIDSAITHASEEAEAGALTIALATYFILNGEKDKDLLSYMLPYITMSDVKEKLCTINAAVNSSVDHSEVLRKLGTRADVRQTVPSAMYCYLKFKNYEDGVVAAISAAYDSDTTGSIVGSLIGARDGINGIPPAWVEGVEDADQLILLDSKLFSRNNKNILKA